MKIGILGGSFDPVHIGHIELVKVVCQKLKLDKIILIPAYKNPFKLNQINENSEARFQMLKIVSPKSWKISRFELNRKRITYAYEVVNSIYKSNDEIYYIIGSDNLKSLHKWKNIHELSSKVRFICLKRSNFSKNKNIKNFNIHVLNNEIYSNSSTKYKEGNINLVDKKIQIYIAKNFLYLKTIAFNTLKFERYIHSINVANLAKKYAKINKLNTKNAFFAGLMHDFTKGWTVEEHHEIMKEYNIEINSKPNPILHQYSAALWMKYIYLCSQDEIISSIMKHTTAALKMSKFDKIIYLADKLAIGRKFKGIQVLRTLACNNVDEAFVKMLKISSEFTIKKHGNLDECSKKIMDRWIK